MITGRTIHQIFLDDILDIDTTVYGADYTEHEGVVVFGRKAIDNLIIIDEVGPLLSRELERLIRPKERKSSKQPDWAKHNQAPRSVRKRR